jgi:P-type conjugative transfer protein TrbJ
MEIAGNTMVNCAIDKTMDPKPGGQGRNNEQAVDVVASTDINVHHNEVRGIQGTESVFTFKMGSERILVEQNLIQTDSGASCVSAGGWGHARWMRQVDGRPVDFMAQDVVIRGNTFRCGGGDGVVAGGHNVTIEGNDGTRPFKEGFPDGFANQGVDDGGEGQGVTDAVGVGAGVILVGGLGSFFGGGGGVGGATEVTQLLNNAQLLAQVANSARQVEMELKNLEVLGIELPPEILDGIGKMQEIIRTARSVSYDVQRIEAEFRRLWPDTWQEALTSAQILARRMEQAESHRDASMASKRASAHAVTRIGHLQQQLSALTQRAATAPGNAARQEAIVQAQVIQAELTAQATVLQATHQRAVESYYDQYAAETDPAAVDAAVRDLWRRSP